MGDFHLGEDIAQEVLAQLFMAGDRVHAPEAYLRKATVNRCRSSLRRSSALKRRVRLVREDSPAGPEEVAEQAAARSVVLLALRQLPARQREALVLRFYAELTETEIAAAMKVSVGSVKVHLHRGLESLRSRTEGLR